MNMVGNYYIFFDFGNFTNIFWAGFVNFVSRVVLSNIVVLNILNKLLGCDFKCPFKALYKGAAVAESA